MEHNFHCPYHELVNEYAAWKWKGGPLPSQDIVASSIMYAYITGEPIPRELLGVLTYAFEALRFQEVLEMLIPSEITLSDVCSPAQFEQENPDLFAGPEAPSMEYLTRLRKINGLEDIGAIIEISPRRFLVVRPIFREWLELRRRGS